MGLVRLPMWPLRGSKHGRLAQDLDSIHESKLAVAGALEQLWS